MSLRRGEILDSRYELLEPLGEGGQGTVWRALDRSTREERALKVLHITDREAFERADREATLLKRAEHPALIPCRSLLRLPAIDMLVLVFDFVESTTLAGALRDPRFGRAHKLAALRHVAGALGYLHAKSIVHRDLKPENVLVTPAFWEDLASPSALKIIDFGIAAPQLGPDGATISGAFGTVPYMAPELLLSPSVDAQRSPSRDVFAFGVMGWEMLANGHPTGLPHRTGIGAFRDSYKHFRRGREAWPPHQIEGRWGSVIGACLALDPAERPEDGRSILRLLDGHTPRPPPSSADARAAEAPSEERRADRVSASTAKHEVPRSDPPPAPPAKRIASPPREPTIGSAPRIAAVERTVLAPASALPKPAPRDPTTPMPPAAEAIERSIAAAKIDRDSKPEQIPAPRDSRPSEEGRAPRGSRPDDERSAGSPSRARAPKEAKISASVWPIVLLALLLSVGVVAVVAWLLLARREQRPSPAPPPMYLAPPRSATPTPIASAAPSTSVEAPPTATPGRPAFDICCPPQKNACPSGRRCTAEKSCKDSVVQGDPEFRLRMIEVDKVRDIYDDEKSNLADDPKKATSEVCVSTSKDKACALLKEIVGSGGARSRRLNVRASDVAQTGLSLRITHPGEQPITAKLLSTGGLRTSGLCKSLAMKTEDRKYTIHFYLDDPSPEADTP